jgi:hypothetical protein
MRCAPNYDTDGMSLADRCPIELKQLYDTYMRMISGNQIEEQQASDYRRQRFARGDASAVLAQYNYWYAICGAASGLPDLSAAAASQRGGPARVGDR